MYQSNNLTYYTGHPASLILSFYPSVGGMYIYACIITIFLSFSLTLLLPSHLSFNKIYLHPLSMYLFISKIDRYCYTYIHFALFKRVFFLPSLIDLLVPRPDIDVKKSVIKNKTGLER